ncbi:uncharacterized protein LOC119382325 [Rhipicephalus sanguineus]|uniref:uncharacterized protein LOC119382325 n=1 Tax=Rhipicephalus sanguineus TaxID=34632 RepID=UPI0020C5849D|nr:uncharacterized protein LOC119382325 [Rhipicephalus sanguineus]
MGRRPFLCTVGASDLHQDSMVPEDGLCECLVFTHYYHSSGDTFADDDANKTRTFLKHAARSSRTTFGLSVTYRNVAAAKRDIARQQGQSKLRHYWSENHIYHYGILDAEYYGFPGNRTRQLQLAFDLLRAFRRIQKRIEPHKGSTSGKPQGFIILGVTPWVRGDKDVFGELSEHMNSFSVDGLILRTHLFENEIASKFRTCHLTPPTSYEKPKSDYLVGMADVLRLYKKHRAPSWRHNLMLSFTMALRWYKTDNGRLDIGAPCDKIRRLAVRVIDAAQMCALSFNFPNVETGVALFDTDFQDWRGSCTRDSQAALKGSVRLRHVRDHYRKASSPKSGSNCPKFSAGSI